MMELADEVVIGYASPGGNLERLCGEYQECGEKHFTIIGVDFKVVKNLREALAM